MFRSSRSENRLLAYWIAFAIAAVGVGMALNHLHQSFQSELAQQGRQALTIQQSQAREKIRTLSAELRRSTIKSLASFHDEGLAHALQAWDRAAPQIVGTFRWENGRGFLSDSVFPPGINERDAAPLWNAF